MSRPDLNVTLRQMLTYAREAMEMAGRTSRAGLESDVVLGRAILHTLEMIGEAAARVSVEERARHPGIPWQSMVDLRNRLIHGYDRVDLDTVWEILQHDLPGLVAELARIVSAA